MANTASLMWSANALLEQHAMSQDLMKQIAACWNCATPALTARNPLRRCTGCKLVDYCSKECQKKHWSNHAWFCKFVTGKTANHPVFMDPQSNRELAVELLIISYKLRAEEDEKKGVRHGRFWTEDIQLDKKLMFAEGDASTDFQHFLDLAEKEAVVPDRWMRRNRAFCTVYAMDRENGCHIDAPITTAELERVNGVLNHSLLPKMIAEKVYGYDGTGPPKGNAWILKFAAEFEEDQGRGREVQRTALENAFNSQPQDVDRNDPGFQAFRQKACSEILGNMTESSWAQFTEAFRPGTSNFSNFESLARKTRPDDKALHESFRSLEKNDFGE